MTGPDAGLPELVAAARDGDRQAWESLVDRFAGLVVAICRRHRLSDSDTGDVSQTVWLRLVEQLPVVRDPQALPGWLVTTTRNECLRLLRTGRRHPAQPLDEQADLVDLSVVDDGLLDDELHAALRAAYAELPERCRRLLGLLLEDPPPSYEAVGAALEMPVGSIGPTRARCLSRLRGRPALAALIGGAAPGRRAGVPERSGR